MEEIIKTKLIKKSSKKADSSIRGGLRQFFNTFFETMANNIKMIFREMRKFVENVQEILQKTKNTNTRSYVQEKTTKLDVTSEIFNVCFDYVVINKALG